MQLLGGLKIGTAAVVEGLQESHMGLWRLWPVCGVAHGGMKRFTGAPVTNPWY